MQSVSPWRQVVAIASTFVVVVVGLLVTEQVGTLAQEADEGDRTVEVLRYQGSTRIDTAVVLSQQSFPDGAEFVVVARSDQYPDALAGGPLAFAVGAPILLTNQSGLDPVAAREITRLGASTAYVLGGPAALSSRVDSNLRTRGVDVVTRLAGDDRFETAGVIAGELLTVTGRTAATDVYLTEGASDDPNRGWPDAVAVAPLAAFQQRPVLLLRRDQLPSSTSVALDELATTAAAAVGGPDAISDDVLDQVRGLGIDVERVAGATRYQTSRLVADRSRDAGMTPERTWFATGTTFADALVGGPVIAADAGVLLLLDGQDIAASPPALAWLDEFRPQIRMVNLLGGPVAISDETRTRIIEELQRRQ